MFINDYVAQNADVIGWCMQAFVPFVHGTIAQENTLEGSVIEFSRVVRVQVGPHADPNTFSWE
jgi:hypothetical protein